MPPSDEDDVLERFRAFRDTGDQAIREELIARFQGMAHACARRFHGRGEPLDDLAELPSRLGFAAG